MTDGTAGVVRHFARKEVTPTGTRLVCRVLDCAWVSTPNDDGTYPSERAQREEQRAHRREMGEDLPDIPLLLEQTERNHYLKILHQGREDNLSTDREGNITRGDVCPTCRVPWPCPTRRLIDGDATMAMEIRENQIA